MAGSARKKSAESRGDGAVDLHTISIYQNAEHVAGLVQQIFNAPLVIEETRESSDDRSRNTEGSGEAELEVAGEAKIPLVVDEKLSGKGSLALSHARAVATGTKSTQNFVYSQAYYLSLVRNALIERDSLVQVETLEDARGLEPGAFVEYEADFSASVLTALMDVISPELISTILRSRVRMTEAKLFESYESMEALQAAAARVEVTANAQGELAGSVANAVKEDFRQDQTREYLGRITGDEVTAVTICDAASFTIADQDRILDGTYRVLGKVVSTVSDDVPVLKRNKLLGSLDAGLVDELFGFAKTSLNELKTDSVEGLDVKKAFDIKLDSRIPGPSFRVIPIAIYA